MENTENLENTENNLSDNLEVITETPETTEISASLKEQANLLLKKEHTIFNLIDDEIAMASKLDNVIERQSKLSYLGKLKSYHSRTN